MYLYCVALFERGSYIYMYEDYMSKCWGGRRVGSVLQDVKPTKFVSVVPFP